MRQMWMHIVFVQGEDDDATVARSRQRHMENQEYEEPEEEDRGDSYEDKCMQTDFYFCVEHSHCVCKCNRLNTNVCM